MTTCYCPDAICGCNPAPIEAVVTESKITPFSTEELTTLAKTIRPFNFPQVNDETAKIIEDALQADFPGGVVEVGEQKALDDLIIPLWIFKYQGRRAFIR